MIVTQYHEIVTPNGPLWSDVESAVALRIPYLRSSDVCVDLSHTYMSERAMGGTAWVEVGAEEYVYEFEFDRDHFTIEDGDRLLQWYKFWKVL